MDNTPARPPKFITPLFQNDSTQINSGHIILANDENELESMHNHAVHFKSDLLRDSQEMSKGALTGE
jgi:hypothetical protein